MSDKKSALEYFNGDEMAADVWQNKYLADGEVNPSDMHHRMTKEYYRIDKSYQDQEANISSEQLQATSAYFKVRKPLTYDRIFGFFDNFKYIVPQGSIMSVLGNDNIIASLSNCFVIGQPEDSYGGIFEKDEEEAHLMKRRGGVGIDISTLRPAETHVSNSAKSSTGAVSFAERYSNTTREVAQAGRRGALMITLDCRHPDVMEFIGVKADRTKVTGANISIMLRDDFMKAVIADEDYILRFPCDANLDKFTKEYIDAPYNYLHYIEDHDNDNSIIYTKKVRAKEVYDSIVQNAWDNAEPGQIFIDKHWNYSPDGVYPQFRGVTTNPCGEIFMQPYDACRLMALNYFSFVVNPFTKDAYFDYKALYEAAYEQQRLADNLIDLELEHISKILAKIHSDPESDEVKAREIALWEKVYDTTKASRRTGCGFTGLGDAIAALGLPYASDEGIKVIDAISHNKFKGELECTIDLAITRGTFEGYNPNLEWKSIITKKNTTKSFGLTGKNTFYKFLLKNYTAQAFKMFKWGRRNVSWATVAPTGTTSMMTQTSSGIEPAYALWYRRRRKVMPNEVDVEITFTDDMGDDWTEYTVLHPKFKEWILINYKYDCEGITDEQLETYYKLSPWFGSTSADIDWTKRVEIQAVVQKYTTHSISSTINLPAEATLEDIDEIYRKSYEMNLKGVTVYRDGSRSGVLISSDSKTSEEFKSHDAPVRPETLESAVQVTSVSGEKFVLIVGLLDNNPYEVFGFRQSESDYKFKNHEKGSTTKISNGNYIFTAEDGTITNVMKPSSDAEEIVTRLISTGLRHGTNIKFLVEQLSKANGDMSSLSKGVSRALKSYIPDGSESTYKCEECGSDEVVFEEGCRTCKSCGSSKCG